MLVLTRRLGQSVVVDLGGEGAQKRLVHVSILSTRSREVKIGIQAPKEIRVLRAELLASSYLRKNR